MEELFYSHSEEETEKIAYNVAKSVNLGELVLLRGNLGAGKTVFSRGFAKALGCVESLSSPTYTIVQEYNLPQKLRLYHLDLYRISDCNAALGFGVDEFLDDPKAYKLVEWPERIEGLLPEKFITVEISHQSEDERLIKVIR